LRSASRIFLGLLLTATASPLLAEPFCAQTRVVGGDLASANSWPSTAGIYKKNRDLVFCGASVIAKDWVLTAAHCIVGEDGGKLQPKDIAIVTGASNWRTGGKKFEVKRILVHEGYRRSPDGNDIALIELASPTTAPPMALVQDHGAPLLAPAGASAVIAGWGTTREGDSSTASADLRQAILPIVDTAICSGTYPGLRESQICAGYDKGGKDACQGDSGGPLMVRDAHGHYAQLAIVSYGRGCARAGLYGVYERPGAHLDWIRQYAGNGIALASLPGTRGASGGEAKDAGLKDVGLSEVAADLFTGDTSGAVSATILPKTQIGIGENIRIRVKSKAGGFLQILDIRENGDLIQLYPNEFSKPAQIAAEETRLIPSDTDGYAFQADEAGRGRIVAIVSEEALKLGELAKQHLDLQPIAAARSHLGALCDALRSAAATTGDPKNPGWAASEQNYEIVK